MVFERTASGTGADITQRAEETVLDAGPRGFYDYPAAIFLEDLYHLTPGSEKSKVATQIATRLWTERQRPTLYLMLTHKAILRRLKHIEEDGNLAYWRHYQGHHKTCRVSRLAKRGYTGGQCTCGHTITSLEPDKPTLAALDVVLSNDANAWAFNTNVQDFPLWIIDEVDFGRFVGECFATDSDIRAVASRYLERTAPHTGTPLSLEPVKQLALALLDVRNDMMETGEERVNAGPLYRAIEEALARKDLKLQQLVAQLEPLLAHLPMSRWAAKQSTPLGSGATLQDQPQNFPPFLVPIFCEEATNYLHGKHFNPRIHLVNQGDRPTLRIRWRREVADTIVGWVDHGSGEFEHVTIEQEIMVLDATADVRLLRKVVPVVNKIYRPPEPGWPDNVHVHQWANSIVSRTELGDSNDDTEEAPYNSSRLDIWYERIKQALDGVDRKLRVGVITYKAIHLQLKAKVESWGFQTVRSMYYFDLKGSNEFEKSHILVLLGCPIPNLTDFEEECDAFLHDHPEQLNFHRNQKALDLVMRDSRKFGVQVYGTWKSPAADYYRQKCQAELYQAVHRLRPYIPRRYQRDIFIFTNMPVQGVEVDEVLVDTEKNWQVAAAQLVRSRLVEADQISANEVATAVVKTPKSIANNGDEIAILAGAWYHSGTKGQGRAVNRFTRQAAAIP